VRVASELDTHEDYKHVPSWILGIFERLLAFFLVAFTIPQTGPILIAWVLAKLAANWQRREPTGDEEKDAAVRSQTFIALMGGVLSIGLGAFGGLLARCTIIGIE